MEIILGIILITLVLIYYIRRCLTEEHIHFDDF